MASPEMFRDYVHSFCFNLVCVIIIYSLASVCHKITNPILNLAKKSTLLFRTKRRYFDSLEIRFFKPWRFQRLKNVVYNNDLVYHPLLGNVDSAAVVFVNNEAYLVYICCGFAEEKFYVFNGDGSFRVSKLQFIGYFSGIRSSVNIHRWTIIDIDNREGNNDIEVESCRSWDIVQVAHHPVLGVRCKLVALKNERIWQSTSPDQRCLGVCTLWKGDCVVMFNMVISNKCGDRLFCYLKTDRGWEYISKSQYVNIAKNIQNTFWKTRAMFACEEFYSFCDIMQDGNSNRIHANPTTTMIATTTDGGDEEGARDEELENRGTATNTAGEASTEEHTCRRRQGQGVGGKGRSD